MEKKYSSNQPTQIIFKFIFRILNSKFSYIILILLISQSNFCWAEGEEFPYDRENKSTFYGRVVEPPPHFKYAHDYDKDFCFEDSSLYVIFCELNETLMQMMNELGYRFSYTVISPPLYVRDCDWGYRMIRNLGHRWPSEFILRESRITKTFPSNIMNYSETMQKIDFLNYWTTLCYDMILLRKRSIIETINDQLKNISQIEHTRHRSIENFLINVLAGLVAYSHQQKKPSLNFDKHLIASA